MKKVTQEEFYVVIGSLDVTCTPTGNYPYITKFCLRNGTEKGMCVGHEMSEPDEYFLI
jgi:hypothetical protein